MASSAPSPSSSNSNSNSNSKVSPTSPPPLSQPPLSQSQPNATPDLPLPPSPSPPPLIAPPPPPPPITSPPPQPPPTLPSPSPPPPPPIPPSPSLSPPPPSQPDSPPPLPLPVPVPASPPPLPPSSPPPPKSKSNTPLSPNSFSSPPPPTSPPSLSTSPPPPPTPTPPPPLPLPSPTTNSSSLPKSPPTDPTTPSASPPLPQFPLATPTTTTPSDSPPNATIVSPDAPGINTNSNVGTNQGNNASPTRAAGEGLSAGAAASIALVIIFLVASFIVAGVWYVKKKRRPANGYNSVFVVPSPVMTSPKSGDTFSPLGRASATPFTYNTNYTSGSLGPKGALTDISLGNSKYFTFEELHDITNGFSANNVLGEGGFGCVYKGQLQDGREVAVKRLTGGGGQGEREFQAEVEIISRVHHRHLVSLVGYCIENEQRLLVYDYVPNTTLHYHLHGLIISLFLYFSLVLLLCFYNSLLYPCLEYYSGVFESLLILDVSVNFCGTELPHFLF